MFVFVWSSRRSRLRVLPQDLRTRLFSVWFCTKHLCFALEGQGMPCEASPHITGHGHRPPAGVLLPSTMFFAGRHSLLPKWHFWAADYCSSAFADILVQLYGILFHSIHVYGGMASLLAYLVSFTRLAPLGFRLDILERKVV